MSDEPHGLAIQAQEKPEPLPQPLEDGLTVCEGLDMRILAAEISLVTLGPPQREHCTGLAVVAEPVSNSNSWPQSRHLYSKRGMGAPG